MCSHGRSINIVPRVFSHNGLRTCRPVREGKEYRAYRSLLQWSVQDLTPEAEVNMGLPRMNWRLGCSVALFLPESELRSMVPLIP